MGARSYRPRREFRANKSWKRRGKGIVRGRAQFYCTLMTNTPFDLESRDIWVVGGASYLGTATTTLLAT